VNWVTQTHGCFYSFLASLPLVYPHQWGSIAIEYRKRYFTRYMSILGDGRFLVGHETLRKGDLYMTSTNSRTSTLVPISEPMLGGHIPFADGKIMP
jgi:hypothetical protein